MRLESGVLFFDDSAFVGSFVRSVCSCFPFGASEERLANCSSCLKARSCVCCLFLLSGAVLEAKLYGVAYSDGRSLSVTIIGVCAVLSPCRKRGEVCRLTA